MTIDWTREIACPVTICSTQGTILYMNQASVDQFSAEGGTALLGTDLMDCHPEPSRTKLASLLESAGTNIYTTEENGERKLIAQLPWYQDGQFAGLVEISIPLPADMPHYLRDGDA